MNLKETNTVPPEGFWYMQPQTGHRHDAGSLVATVAYFLTHRKANGLERATIAETREDVETQICQRVPCSLCNDCGHPEWGFDFETIVRAGKALVGVIDAKLFGRSPFVAQEEADARAARCAKCFRNTSLSGCGPGCKMREHMAELFGITIGSRKSEKDERLRNCHVCGCSCRVIVHYDLDILKASTSAAQQAAFDETPGCWRGCNTL